MPLKKKNELDYLKGEKSMTGFRSKKMSNDIRWIGPYKSDDRHADPITIDHVIELRNRIDALEAQLSRALDKCVAQEKTISAIKSLVRDKHWVGD